MPNYTQDSMPLIDAPEKNYSGAGPTITCRYLVKKENESAIPVRGDLADSRYCPLNTKYPWRAAEVTRQALSPYHWLVTCVYGRRIRVETSYKMLKEQFEIEMGMDQFHLTPQMMGLEPTDSAKVDEEGYKEAITDVPNWVVAVIDSGTGYRPAFEDWCDLTTLSHPFTLTPDTSCVDRTFPALTFTVTLYRDLSSGGLHSLGAFQGVNGTIPSKYDLPDYNVAGKWRAVDQRVRLLYDDDADEFYEITRTAMHVPSGMTSVTGDALLWSADKNGGTWTWP